MVVTCHCFFHPAKKLRSGAIVRFSDNSSFPQICRRVIALGWPFIYAIISFAQYLENELTESEQIFVCTSTLTRSSLGLLIVIFGQNLMELWPLIDVRISFPLNILRTN